MQKKRLCGIIFSIVMMMAVSGFAQNFNISDLAGTWHAYIMETNQAVGTYWIYGSFTIDSSGNITGGTVMTGVLTAEGGVTGSFPSGKMDSDKTIISFVGADSNGSLDLGVAIKGGVTAMPWIPLLLLDEEFSADYWVDSSKGSNANPGTENKPFKTITKALGLVTAGHTVYVAPGTYDLANGETFPLQLPAGAILIGDEANKGAGTPPTVIKGGSPTGFIGTSIEAGANSVIAGFTILHDDAGATFNMNIAITNDGITLRNNHVIDGSNNGIYIYKGADNHTIVGNVIQGNNSNGLIFRDGGVGSLVEDNLITGNRYGVAYDSPGGDLGGGATGSNGGNIISCNTENDLWTNAGVTIDAQNNFWDHVPPTVSDVGTADIDIRRDLSSTVITTGAVLAPSPCL